MVKSDKDVIADWNKQINVTAEELDKWLKSPKSKKAGWSKEDGSGEAIGHESGRKIVEILKKNPNKDPEKYDEKDIQHMRRVVAYNKRHLAQESKLKNNPDYENSKSFISLMNWGHNPLKSEEKSASKPRAKSSAKRKHTDADQGDVTADVVEKGPKEESTESKLGVANKKTKVAANNAGPSAETKKAKKSTRTK